MKTIHDGEATQSISREVATFWICAQIRNAKALWHFWQRRQI